MSSNSILIRRVNSPTEKMRPGSDGAVVVALGMDKMAVLFAAYFLCFAFCIDLTTCASSASAMIKLTPRMTSLLFP